MSKPLMAGLIKARAMQLYYHYCHNLVKGATFQQDHEFFNASYTALETDYDSLAEYFVSLNGNSSFKTKQVTELVLAELEGLAVEKMPADDMYREAVKMEEEYQKAAWEREGLNEALESEGFKTIKEKMDFLNAKALEQAEKQIEEIEKNKS
jgi:DNA-binding ferritin-like protein